MLFCLFYRLTRNSELLLMFPLLLIGHSRHIHCFKGCKFSLCVSLFELSIGKVCSFLSCSHSADLRYNIIVDFLVMSLCISLSELLISLETMLQDDITDNILILEVSRIHNPTYLIEHRVKELLSI